MRLVLPTFYEKDGVQRKAFDVLWKTCHVQTGGPLRSCHLSCTAVRWPNATV